MKWEKVLETGILVFVLIAGIKLGQTWTARFFSVPNNQ